MGRAAGDPGIDTFCFYIETTRKCMVRRLTAREKRRVERQICANVFVNKGEGASVALQLNPGIATVYFQSLSGI
jgi:hypothetical protein